MRGKSAEITLAGSFPVALVDVEFPNQEIVIFCHPSFVTPVVDHFDLAVDIGMY